MKYELNRLGGLHEIAKECGVTYGRAAQLPLTKGFPDPVLTLGRRTKIWDLDSVLAWREQADKAQNRNRRENVEKMIRDMQAELLTLDES